MNHSWKKSFLRISSAVALSATLFISGTVTASATGVGEMPVAGISVSLDKYYNAVNSSDVAVIQTLSLEKDYGDNLGIADVENHLNIRKGPGTNYSVVGKLPKDAGCYIHEVDENGWAKISSGGVKGYVDTQYLITGEDAKIKAIEVGFYAATVTTITLNVREEPTTDSKILTQIGNSASFEVVADDTIGEEWVKIKVDDDEGYVSADYVQIEYQLKRAVAEYTLSVGGSSGVSSTRAGMVAWAKNYLGNPYRYGGTSLSKGIDCSAFMQKIYANYGYSLPRTSREQAKKGTSISLQNVKPGDLVFYSKGGTITHVAMYIGNGQIIHASNPRDGIKISNMYYQMPCKAVRIIND